MTNLKPCPFCGNKAEIFDSFDGEMVYCSKCFCTKQGVITWNRRPTTELKELDDIPVTACCGIGPITNEKYCPNCGKEIINKKTI